MPGVAAVPDWPCAAGTPVPLPPVAPSVTGVCVVQLADDAEGGIVRRVWHVRVVGGVPAGDPPALTRLDAERLADGPLPRRAWVRVLGPGLTLVGRHAVRLVRA